MNAQTNFAPRPVQTVAVAAIATVLAVTVLWAVVTLFQSRGAPLEQLAAAERACADKPYQSERQACMSEWIAKSQPTNIVGQ